MRGEKHEACQVLFDHIKQGHYTFSQICVKGNKTVPFQPAKNTGFLGDANKVAQSSLVPSQLCWQGILPTLSGKMQIQWQNCPSHRLAVTDNIKSKISTIFCRGPITWARPEVCVQMNCAPSLTMSDKLLSCTQEREGEELCTGACGDKTRRNDFKLK